MVSINLIVSAFKNLAGHRWAAFLSVLGVALGIVAVVIVGSLGAGTQKELTLNMELLGSNILTISPGKFKKIANREREAEEVDTLIIQDAGAIQDLSTKIKRVIPVQARLMTLKAGNNLMSVAVIGTTAEYQKTKNIELQYGTFFNDDDNSRMKKVVVLGSSAAKKIFKDENPIGNRVYIGKVIFEVVGVMEKRGTDIGGSDEDVQAFIPIKTAARRLFNMDHLHTLLVQVEDALQMKEMSLQIEALLREQHRLRDKVENDFLIQNQNDLLEAEKNSRQEFSKLLFGVATFLVLAGGFGILSVMLILVKERTGEIGLRRAIGARKSDILLQFLSETVILCVSGGTVGTIVGLISAKGVSRWAGFPSVVDPQVILMSLVFSFGVGGIFGIYPAVKAARLDPVNGLRSQ